MDSTIARPGAPMCRQPVGGHEPFGMYAGRQGGARVCGKRHIIEPTAMTWPSATATVLGRPHFLPTVRRRTAQYRCTSDRSNGRLKPIAIRRIALARRR